MCLQVCPCAGCPIESVVYLCIDLAAGHLTHSALRDRGSSLEIRSLKRSRQRFLIMSGTAASAPISSDDGSYSCAMRTGFCYTIRPRVTCLQVREREREEMQRD